MIYVSRHGQTEWNVQNKVCGRTDVELTKVGREQAEKLAKIVAGKNIDFIISSPLKRAIETSKIVANSCNVPVEIDERLIEQDYGIYEGVDRKNEDFLNNKRNFAFKYPKGESMMQVAYRVYGLLEEIIENKADENVLLVCHGGVCRIINTYFKDMTNQEFFEFSPENASVLEYKLDNE